MAFSPVSYTHLDVYKRQMDNYLRRDAVEKFLADYEQVAEKEGGWFWHRQNKALQYFNLLTLVVWWEEFVEGHEVKF